MSVSDMKPTLWIKIVRERYRERERKRQETLERVRRLLKNFFKDKDVGSVYLFGSITIEGRFYDHSDVDVAIDHLPRDMDRWELESMLEELLQREIDLIILEKCRFAQKIKEKGLKIL